MEISVGMVIRDGLGIKACEIKRKKQDKAEGKNTHCGGKDTDGPREYSLVWALESRLKGEISVTSDMKMNPP